jgi:predicted metal-dependent phosphoesterase TrpH
MNSHIDLHLHSTCSDGTFSPEEVAWRAIEADLSIISLTDHDSIEGVAAAQKEGEKLGLEVITGTELSAQADGTDIHILGYHIQGDHPGLADCLDTCRNERKNRAERIVKKLNSMGLRIGFEQVLAKAGNGAIGRPHVADVLVEEGLVFSSNEAFQKYLGYSKPAYEPKHTLSPSDAIQVIHSAGGLACLAHPGLYGRDDLIPELVEAGLDGIEVRHTKHGPTEIKRYTNIADQFGLLPTGGSDCHGDGRGSSVIGTVDVPRSYADGLSERLNALSPEVEES